MLPTALLLAAVWMVPGSLQGQPKYRPAKTDYGKVISAWEYQGPWHRTIPSKLKLVAAEIELPPAKERFDLDDIDIFDADTGEWFGSDPAIQRLTLKGEFVPEDDPEVKDQAAYRGVFVWAVRRTVRRVNFGYWGEMLYKEPVTLQTKGRVLPPDPTLEVAALGPNGSAPGFTRHLAVLHARDWPRTGTPEAYTLYGPDPRPDGEICNWDAWVDVDALGRPVDRPLTARPYYEKERWFLVEFWCPRGTSPDALNLFGEHTRLPRTAPPEVGSEALKRLAAAEKNPAARHRRTPE